MYMDYNNYQFEPNNNVIKSKYFDIEDNKIRPAVMPPQPQPQLQLQLQLQLKIEYICIGIDAVSIIILYNLNK